MRKIITILMLVAFTTCIYAQNIQLRGRILSGKDPIEFANIVLQTKKDSAFVNGGISDRRGRFSFENVPSGNYCMVVSSIGYDTRRINIEDLSKTTDIGNIELDSTTVVMNEVVVKASHVIRQTDKQIYLPTAHQIKASTNGVNILQQMKLGRIQVDPMRMSITSSNEGEVQLRINGGKANIQEVQALRPEDIQRIDYYDDPSLRFGDKVAAVIDYITKRPQSGGYIGIDTQNSPFIGFGNNGATGKFNYKKSEFTLNYWGMYRDLGNLWNDRTENFLFEDGSRFTRISDGVPSPMNENHHYLTLGYSYQEPNKWSLIVRLRGNLDNSKEKEMSNLYPINDPTDNVSMVNDTKDRYTRPSLDIYFQRDFKNKQTLIMNLVGTYIDSDVHRYYTESKDEQTLTDIRSKTTGNKYSLIGQAVYEKGFKTGKLSLGTNFSYAYTDNLYTGTVNTATRMHDFYDMFYAEYSGKIGKKINYKLGMSNIYGGYSQGDNSYSKFVLSPDFRIGYTINDCSSLRLRSRINYNTPDLSDLSDVEQLIDSLQIRRGNPNLKETRYFNTTLYYEYRKGLFYGNFNMLYQFQHHPMMEETYREGNKFILTTLNQPSWQKVNPEMELKVGPIKDILSLSLTGGMNYFDSKGIDYHHYYTNWYYRAELTAMYKKFTLMFQMQNHKNNFYGETASWGESYHIMMVNYKVRPSMNIGIMALDPFISSYRRPTDNRNQYASSSQCMYMEKGMRVICATFSWNFSFGRKYKSAEQRLDNEDTKSGTLKGSR